MIIIYNIISGNKVKEITVSKTHYQLYKSGQYINVCDDNYSKLYDANMNEIISINVSKNNSISRILKKSNTFYYLKRNNYNFFFLLLKIFLFLSKYKVEFSQKTNLNHIFYINTKLISLKLFFLVYLKPFNKKVLI